MLSIQEMVQKTTEQRKQIRRVLGSGTFHPSDASILQKQKPADYWELRESIRKIPLAEFLGKSQTAGGADYLIPDKLYDTLIQYSQETDKVPVLSMAIAERWQGGDLKVAVVYDKEQSGGTRILAKEFASGGRMPTETIATKSSTALTITPKSFGITIQIGQDLIEDANWDLVEFHTRHAALAMGEKATKLALAVLNTGTDGIGTLNASSTGNNNETKWMGATTAGITEAIDLNLDDHWISNTIVITGEAWSHSVSETLPVGSTYMPVKLGFTHCINDMDIMIHTDAADIRTAATRMDTLVFDRNNALLTGRKRWMQIENYANPIADLFGAVVTGRQDSVTVYNDAICKLTEPTA